MMTLSDVSGLAASQSSNKSIVQEEEGKLNINLGRDTDNFAYSEHPSNFNHSLAATFHLRYPSVQNIIEQEFFIT